MSAYCQVFILLKGTGREMLKISVFSKLSRVSVKTLRFYDELGLLKPATVDKKHSANLNTTCCSVLFLPNV
ncbi:hypothetical protein QOZ95_005269 [Paenibacillus brasilensis]|uniref:HTH merR-type domain-containing protein n=1 Tax=Paenibacillus brasilensis TaxID=128574 RepID=A0ABU0L6Y9_9BACL|nr:hypothetical protein [Paenibacillus brasilensis]